MGESSAVTAQRLANESNERLAKEANEFNVSMMREQNNWNEMMWNKENTYNDPSAQMNRFIQAGINPVWAMSEGSLSPGTASHLESADAKPAEVAHVQPEYDPYKAQHIGNIISVARDMANAALGYGQLGLQERDVSTRERSQLTRSDLDRATAAEKRAQTVGQNLSNQWDLKTFDVRVHEEAQKLRNLESQLSKTEADTEVSKSTKLQIDESRKLISEQINQVIAGIRQRDRELDIMSRNATSMERNAATNEFAAQTRRQEFQLADERFTQELKKWNNDALMQYMYRFGRRVEGEVKGSVGVEGLGLSGKAGISELSPAKLSEMRECGIEIYHRAADDPNEKNLHDAEYITPIMNAIEAEIHKRTVLPVDQFLNTSNASVLNYSDQDW